MLTDIRYRHGVKKPVLKDDKQQGLSWMGPVPRPSCYLLPLESLVGD
jgi:hypothetical protein